MTKNKNRIKVRETLKLKKKNVKDFALAGVTQLLGALSSNRKAAGSIPHQDTYLSCSSVPSSGA